MTESSNSDRFVWLSKDQLLILLWIAHVGTDNWMHATLSCWLLALRKHFASLTKNSKLVVPTCLNSLFMFVCLSSFFTTRCKRFTTCWNSKLLMWNQVQSSCVPQDTTFARFIWGAGLLKQRGSPPAAEMRCASAWHAWNERLPEKYAISCSGAACLCTLQNASRCTQYDLNNFKISRQNPSEVSWCHESMKASCTTTWSSFFLPGKLVDCLPFSISQTCQIAIFLNYMSMFLLPGTGGRTGVA